MKMMTFVLASLVLSLGPVEASDQKALKRGWQYLARVQHEDGSFGSMKADTGITALVALALGEAKDQALVNAYHKAIDYVLLHQTKAGFFADEDGKLRNYKTSLAIRLLNQADPQKYATQIKAGHDFLRSLQFTDPKDLVNFGAVGYGSKVMGDMSNTQMAVEALIETGMPVDDPALKRVVTFMNRVQNRSESNDSGDALTDDGGFRYGVGPANKGKGPIQVLPNGRQASNSYGSMTYAGLKTMMYAQLSKSDPRVKACLTWISNNYTLDENPGLSTQQEPHLGLQGLFYYYMVMAKALSVADIDTIVDSQEVSHDWRQELRDKLSSMQNDDGSWVNSHSRWYESDPQLVTAYAVLAWKSSLKNAESP